MELSEIRKICLNCMNISEEEEVCPICGKPKRGTKSFGRALDPGTILNGKIIIGNILGMGSFGITYMAFDMLLEYRVAIKEFFPADLVERDTNDSLYVPEGVSVEEYEEELKAYQYEAKVLAQFSKHPGIVSIKELFYQNNTAYMVMEYLEGGTLRRYIDTHGGRLEVDHALSLMEPVITSMEEIHNCGLIHRDISPENIMLDTDGSIKVIDFGATKKLSTKTSQVYFGKFGYAPLEQMIGEGQGPWTDVYGICATLYCMITGDIPTDSYQRSLNEPLKHILEYGIPMERRIADTIMRGLAMDCDARPQDMGQLQQQLYGRKGPKTDAMGKQYVHSSRNLMIYDKRNGRVWFGHYPMNEVVGSQLTTDIIYANYDGFDSVTLDQGKYKRFSIKDAPMTKEYRTLNKQRIKDESRMYRFFECSDIPWIILHQAGNKMILQSEYVLDYQLFDEWSYLDMSEREIAKIRTGISWEQSRIREWLNRDFLREAFTKEEQEKIIIKEVNTPISSFTDQTTYDRVFIPSVEEVMSGFDNRAIRGGNVLKAPLAQSKLLFSQYAAAKKVDDSLPTGYALRTRGTINAEKAILNYGESCDGHSIQEGKMKLWKLGVPMGIRPIIQVDVSDIVEV